MSIPSMQMIAEACCERTGLSYKSCDGLWSNRRSHAHLVTRALIVYIGKKYNYSYVEVAGGANYLSHSSAIIGHAKVKSGEYDGLLKILGRKRLTNVAAGIVRDLDAANV